MKGNDLPIVSLRRYLHNLIVFLALIGTFAGCTTPTRYLIIEANDLGMAAEVDAASIRSLELGIVKSASIMAPAPHFSTIAEYAKNHPEFDWGVHLTLNAEWDEYTWGPVLPREQVPSLVTAKGNLHQTVKAVAALADAKEVKLELTAQIEKVIEAGIPISHLDTHMYALTERPDLFRVYLELGEQFNVPCLLPETSDWQWYTHPSNQTLVENTIKNYRSKNFPVVAYYDSRNYTKHPAKRRDYIMSIVTNIPKGLSLIAIHPAEKSSAFRAVVKDYARREKDTEIFTDPEIQKHMERASVVLTSWKEYQSLLKRKSQ